MRDIIYGSIMVLILTCCSCKSNTETKLAEKSTFETISKPEKEQIIKKKSNFKPDTSINDLELVNPDSVLKSVGNLKKLIKEEEGLPYVEFTNIDKDLKLTLTLFPGSSNNDIYQFKVERLLNSKDIKALQFKSFVTESNIKLGMSKGELIKIKGKDYIIEGNVLIYSLSYDIDKDFLEKYNMPYYYANYTFDKDVLTKFDFGFSYP